MFVKYTIKGIKSDSIRKLTIENSFKYDMIKFNSKKDRCDGCV